VCPIASDRPESGLRIAIERAKDADAPWRYAGAAHAPHATFPLSVVVAEDGTAEVALAPSESGDAPPPDLAERVRLLVRAAYRQALAEGRAPAWRIVRWRGEK
jgi:hypothetical protein